MIRSKLFLSCLVCLALGACANKNDDKATEPPVESTSSPSAAKTPAATAEQAGPQPLKLAILIGENALLVGCASGTADCPETRKLAHCGDTVDRAALVNTLCSIANAVDAPFAEVYVSAEPSIRNQRVIDVMDVLQLGGFKRIALSPAEDLGLEGSAQAADGPTPCSARAAACDAPIVVNDIAPPSVAIEAQPVLAVSTTYININGKRLMSLEELETDSAQALSTLQTTLEALRQVTPSGWMIVQADKSLTAKFLVPITNAANKAGFDHLQYAVEKK